MPEDIAFNIAVYAKTNVGRVRSGNEDNFLVLNLASADAWVSHGIDEDPPERFTTFTQSKLGSVLAVSDGMGGALAGEVASRLAVECVCEQMLRIQVDENYSQFPFPERMRLAIEMANAFIHHQSRTVPQYSGMGATFTGIGLNGTTAYFAQVGDSRAYLIRDDRIQQMTRDQSLVEQLVEMGQITAEEAAKHQYKNVILQALGATPRVNAVVEKLRLRDLDIVVLCSDGLSNKVQTDEINHIVHAAPNLKHACEMLIDLANERGGEDNITVIVAQFSGKALQLNATSPLVFTEPLASSGGGNIGSGNTGGANQPSAIPNRWGAEPVPRDANLPPDPSYLIFEEEMEDTAKPTNRLNQNS